MKNYIRCIAVLAILMGFYQNFAFGQNKPVPVTKAQEKEALRKAEQIYQKVKDGEDFEKLAVQYSDDIVSARRGGDMGFAKHGQMVPEFEKAAMLLKPGQVSKPIRTEFEYYITQLITITDEGYRSRHILVRPQ